VRIWDVDPACLCRGHLLGEHRELHGLWNVLTQDLRGYRAHPETRRWEGRLAALFNRHAALVAEMRRRAYKHHSDLDARLATGLDYQDVFVDPVAKQFDILTAKPCPCAPPAVAQ
jgi:hypothetical protein